jgi:hypothetical protein
VDVYILKHFSRIVVGPPCQQQQFRNESAQTKSFLALSMTIWNIAFSCVFESFV